MPKDARPEPVQRTDGERRLEDSWEATPIALARVAAIFVLMFLFSGLIVAGLARLVRRVRAACVQRRVRLDSSYDERDFR